MASESQHKFRTIDEIRSQLLAYAPTNAPHQHHTHTANMLAASRVAAFKPVSLSQRRVFAAAGICSPRQHAVASRVRVQAQEDNSTQVRLFKHDLARCMVSCRVSHGYCLVELHMPMQGSSRST